MESLEVQEFLLSTTATNNSLLLETDKIFEKTADPNNSTQSSLYYSIADDTLSNGLMDDVQQRTLTGVVEEEEEEVEQKTVELSSVILNNNNNNPDEFSFQQNLPLKELLFPNHPLRSQCSTPKLEIVPPKKTPQVIDHPLTVPAPDILMPLGKLLQKIEGKKSVTIMEEAPVPAPTPAEVSENKENVREEPQLKQAKIDKTQKTVTIQEKTTTEPKIKTGTVPKRPATSLRKSMIPGAPTGANPPPVKDLPTKVSRPSMIAPRKSVRLSLVPPTYKSSRFTIGGAGGRSGKINSPSTIKMKKPIPSTATSTAVPAKPNTLPSRMTINTAAKPVTDKKPTAEEKVSKRLSRIPPPQASKPAAPTSANGATTTATSSIPSASHPRPDFACKICKKSFHLKSTLLTHQKIHAKTSSSGVAGGTAAPITGAHFKCTFCDKDFEKEVGLRNHVERYCEKVPVAEKRKMNHSRTRTTSAEIKDRSKRDKSSKLESTSSSVGSDASLKVATKAKKPAPAAAKSETVAQPPPPPASGLSPRKPIKSIIQPHSGVKFTANKPITCFQCKTTFSRYVDFHLHVDEMHPPQMTSPVQVMVVESVMEEVGGDAQQEEEKNAL